MFPFSSLPIIFAGVFGICMRTKEEIEHEGIVRSVTAQTLEIVIVSRSACAGCHAKGACGMADMKQKLITAQRPEGEFKAGDKVMVYASLSNAFYSVLLAYILPSVLLIAAIFFIEQSGCRELAAAVSSLSLLVLYFVMLYLFRGRINRKIKFNVKKTGNY